MLTYLPTVVTHASEILINLRRKFCSYIVESGTEFRCSKILYGLPFLNSLLHSF
jgi:hypothetical protein